MQYGKNWNPAEYYKDSAIAENYDRDRFGNIFGKAFNHFEKRLIRKIFSNLPRGACVLDAPCGTGRIAEILLEMGLRVIGVDISPAMLETAAAKLRRFGNSFTCKVCDVHNLNQLDQLADGAICARVLMHLPFAEQVDFLHNVAKVTRGNVAFTQGLDNSYHRLRRRMKRLLGNQAPASYPVTNLQLGKLIAQAELSETRRYFVLPFLSESIVVVTARK